MPYAVTINKCGGSDEFSYGPIDVPAPAAGQVSIHHEAIGLNYIDVYFRSGLYPIPQFPAVVGMEGAGTVTSIGEGVSEFSVGDRVAYAAPPIGAYATDRVMRADGIVKLPASIGFDTAAAMMLQGMTVQYLIKQTYEVKPGDTVLFHAAAGGVGLIACQWLKHLGATIIGTVGSEEKADLAKQNGCDHTILYKSENIAERVKELTGGKGVPVVYDSIGASTLEASLDSLMPRGLLVSFGNASGPVTNFNFGTLGAKGSLYVTRPSLMTYIADRANMLTMAQDLFDVVSGGAINIAINQRYPLSDAAKAHDALESRATTGSTIFTT
ncbi:MAG: NADPH2:quinone reductase [Granulosicoccus sp.]|jgi:NADPH2:quinone reductase